MLRSHAVAVLLVTSSGCFIEARGRADVVSGAGSAVGGGLVEAAVMAGVEIAMDKGARYHALLAGGEERLVAATRSTAIDGVNAPRIEAGVTGPWPGSSNLVHGFDLRLAVAGATPPGGGEVSQVRLGGAVRMGPQHFSLLFGPAASYWDAARLGTALSIGVEAALHVRIEPMDLIP